MNRTREWPCFSLSYPPFVLALLTCTLSVASCGGQAKPSGSVNAAIDPADIDTVSAPLTACPDGGQLNFGAVSLVIPAGALSQCVQISLHLGDAVTVDPNTLYANSEPYASHPLIFEPHGLHFKTPIVVLITANRRLDPGTLIPVLYKDYDPSAWQGLYLSNGELPAVGVVLADGGTVAYATDHFSQYVQFEPGLVSELLTKCGPFQTVNGSVPFVCPQYLFGNGWPAALGLADASARTSAYRYAISDLVRAPEVPYPTEAAEGVNNVVDWFSRRLGFVDLTNHIAGDEVFSALSKVFPSWAQFEGSNGGFALVQTRIHGEVSGILDGFDRADLIRMVAHQVGQTALAIWALNVMDYAAAVNRLAVLKMLVNKSPLGKDPALQAALGQVALDIEQDFDARGRGIVTLLQRALVNRIDSLDWVSNYPELAGITTSAIGLVVELTADANFIAFAANMLIDWASTLAEATRGEEYLSALGTLFLYGGLSPDYARAGLRVALPMAITSQAQSDMWTRDFLAETALYRMAEQAAKAVKLSDVTDTQWVLQRLGEALDNHLLGLGLDRTAIAARISAQGGQHRSNAAAIRAALLHRQPLPPDPTPVVRVSPGSGLRGTVFNEPGSGFTPGAAVTLHFRRPDGTEAATATEYANLAGAYSHSFVSDGGTMLGTWTYWAVDNTTGIAASPVTVAIVATPLTPTVSVSPSRGPRGTTFVEPGSGFTPSGSVTLHFRRPDGTEAPTASHVADASGAYSHSFTSDGGTMLGSWTYWAIDNTTGIAASPVTLAIVATPLTPTVSVSPSSGPRSTTFLEPGNGFTPGGSVTLHFRRPDGTEAPTASHIADASGAYSHSFASASGTMLGTWTYWAVDDTTSISSSAVSLTIIVAPSVSVSPASGPRGTVFQEPGSGFTPGGSVTLHFRRPDGTEAPTASHIADASGAYSHSFASASGTMLGTWTYWAIDDTTGTASGAVTLYLSP